MASSIVFDRVFFAINPVDEASLRGRDKEARVHGGWGRGIH